MAQTQISYQPMAPGGDGLEHEQENTQVSRADAEVGTGGPDPTLKNHKNIGFLSNTGPDHPPPPPKKKKKKKKKKKLQSYQASIRRHTSETSFKWRFAGVPMMVRLKWYF